MLPHIRPRAWAKVLWLSTLTLVLATSAAAEYDVPTGSRPSPLFGAKEFTQRMLRFEEFGNRDLPAVECEDCTVLPPAESCGVGPLASDLDSFLAERISPLPTRAANDLLPSPWQARVEECIRPLSGSVMEGRPGGEFFAHQRWSEFPPKEYAVTATTGARTNGGVRNAWQLHNYELGEFGPGGLYHNTTGNPGFEGTTKDISVQFHPKLPVQHPDALWTWDGTFPPKLMMARYGEPILFRHHNALPVDPSANLGFGRHTLSTHEHNGHNPAESDGYTQAFFFPGQFFDYRWPMILAGHDSINTDASDPRAGTPDGNGGVKKIRGDWRETMSTHWFHDHMLDFTAQNVYKGSAAMMNYYSAVDRGNEGLDCHYEDPNNANLCLPSGTALDWGNRDYDVNLMIAGKAWDATGQLLFNIFNLDGFVGDRMLVNWLYKPYLEVRGRRYRLRLLNGSVSRYIKIAVIHESGARVPYHLIANDGNIMEHSIRFPNSESQDLPMQAIAERYDIIIDFSQFDVGDKIYLVNLVEHKDGREPEGDPVPLAQVLDGSYFDGPEGRGKFDPVIGKFMEFRVVEYNGTDTSMDPADYEEGKKKMIPLPRFTDSELANARHRTFEFGRSSGTDSQPWTIKTDGGQGLGMDPHRLSAAPDNGDVEIWHISTGGGWAHPVHIHFEEGQILSKDNGVPSWERLARKDVYRIGSEADSTREMSIALRFREFLGSYMEHCHNTQHEDHAMLLRWDIENPGQLVVMPTPEPTWEGVFYADSFTLPTYKTGDDDPDGGNSGPGGPACGNLVVETGETCDDGNGVPGDGCDGLCQLEDPGTGPVCGDGNVDAGEQCDDGNTSSGDGCSATCETEVPAAVCGDGNVDAGEQCDDGNTSSGDGCSATCETEAPAPVCGDGNVDSGEQCDDGNTSSGDGCSATCETEVPAAVCGDGNVDAGEQCDDGNTSSGDGCSATCTTESTGGEVIDTVTADRRGRVSARGRVDRGASVEADNSGVSCSTRSDGRYSCGGSGLEPGTVVNILLVP